MNDLFDRLIIIQKQDEETEMWKDYRRVHASINTPTTGNNQSLYSDAGATRGHGRLNFRIRYRGWIEEIRHQRATHRIVYRGHLYSIEGFDDYLQQHRVVTITGEAL